MKVSLPDKRTVSGKKGQKLGGVSGQPHWSVLAFFGPVALLQKHTRAESEWAWFIGRGGGCQCVLTRQERRLVFWEPVLPRLHLCRTLQRRRNIWC